MKYENLVRIEAKKTVWPANKEENFEAYETKEADEAFEEILAWYKDAENKSKALDNELFETKAELNANKITTSKTIEDLTKKNKELEESNTSYYYKTEALTTELNQLKNDYENAKNQLLVANSNFSNLTNKLNESYEKINNRENKINMLNTSYKELEEKLTKKQVEIDKLNIEYESLNDKYITLTRSLNQIAEITSFFNQWKKNN